jgi:hypothetical protein
MLLRYKKYKFGDNMSGLPYGQIGDFLGQTADTLTPTNQYGVKSNFNAGLGAGLKGAGQGAAMGTMIMPGLGTVIGGAAGLIGGAISGVVKNNKERDEAAKQQSLYEMMMNKKYAAKLSNYDTTGSNQNQIYAKLGGNVPISNHLSIGGKLDKLAPNRYEVDGRTHEEGGVKFPNINAELEDGETVSGDYVFSEVLGYAGKHKPIARMIGKMEKKPNNPITRQTIEFLKEKEERLKGEQEQTKASLDNTISNIMKYGGKLNRKSC